MSGLDVFPVSAPLNVGDGASANPEPETQLLLGHLSSGRPDSQDIGLAEFGAGGTRTAETYRHQEAHRDSMANICAPSGTWPQECLGDQAVNPVFPALAVARKDDIKIAIAGPVFENALRVGTLPAGHPTHPAEVRDLVPALPADDGEPSFLRQGKLCRLGVHREPPFSVSCGRAPHSVAATLII